MSAKGNGARGAKSKIDGKRATKALVVAAFSDGDDRAKILAMSFERVWLSTSLKFLGGEGSDDLASLTLRPIRRPPLELISR